MSITIAIIKSVIRFTGYLIPRHVLPGVISNATLHMSGVIFSIQLTAFYGKGEFFTTLLVY